MEPALLIILMKISGLVGSVFTAYKLFQEVFLNKKPRLRDEYKFAKDFLNDIAAVEQRHPYLIEKGYAAISGKESLTAKEIIYLLSQPGHLFLLGNMQRHAVMLCSTKIKIELIMSAKI